MVLFVWKSKIKGASTGVRGKVRAGTLKFR